MAKRRSGEQWTVKPSSSWLPMSVDPDIAELAGDRLEATSASPRIEGYQLRDLLGEGGMGTVWRATQLSTGRAVALKLMRGAMFGSPRASARFEREVELLARLEHPHIARLYHSGSHQGIRFYAMQLIEGLPMDEWVEKRRPDRPLLLRTAACVARAVDHAHRRGIIHRDLKPSNILVDAADIPYVLDFGLAKSLETGQAMTVTLEGATAGTPQYMAPEQAAGEHERLDTRCDVYSLGVLLYQLLTGQLPYGEHRSVATLHQAISQAEPRRPSSFSPTVDRELEAIVLKAISKEPDDRYATAGEFANDLDNYLRGEPLRARPLTLAYFLRKRLARHRVAVAAALLAVIVLVAGMSWSYVAVSRARDLAQAHAADAEHALYLNRIALARAALDAGDGPQALDVLSRCPERERNWEWHHLRRLADGSRLTIEAEQQVRSAALTDDGRVIVAVLDRRHWTVWDAATGEKRDERDLGEGASAVVSKSGDALLIHRDGRLSLVDALTLEPIASIELPAAAVRLAVSPSGAFASAWDDQRQLHHWNTHTGDLTSHAVPDLLAQCLADDGLLVYSTADDVRIHRTTPDTNDDRFSTLTTNAEQRHLALDVQARRLLMGSSAGEVTLLNLEDQEVRFTFTSPYAVAGLALDHVGEHAFVTTRRADIGWLDARTGRLLNWLHGLPHAASSPHIDERSGQLLAYGDRHLKLWVLDDWRSTGRINLVPHEVIYELGAGTDGSIVALTAQEALRLDANGHQASRHHVQARAVAAAPTPTELILATQDNRLIRISSSGELTAEPVTPSPRTPLYPLVSSGDGRWLAFPDEEGGIAVRSLFEGGPGQQSFQGQFPVVFDAGADGLIAIDAADPRTVIVYDIVSGEPRTRLRAEAPVALDMALSGDGRRLATWHVDGWVRFWHVHDGKVVGRCRVGTESTLIALNHDGSRMLTAAPLLPLFDTRTGERVLDLLPYDVGGIAAVRFSADDRLIAAGSSSGLHLFAGP